MVNTATHTESIALYLQRVALLYFLQHLLSRIQIHVPDLYLMAQLVQARLLPAVHAVGEATHVCLRVLGTHDAGGVKGDGSCHWEDVAHRVYIEGLCDCKCLDINGFRSNLCEPFSKLSLVT